MCSLFKLQLEKDKDKVCLRSERSFNREIIDFNFTIYVKAIENEKYY